MFKKILSVVTLVLIAIIAYKAFSAPAPGDMTGMTMFEATVASLKDMNGWVLLLLIPEQLFMYYAAGKIYFAFLQQRKSFKISQGKLTRISLEINFMNHAIPSGGMSGLAYLVWRLKDYTVPAGQISFIHILRYGICALANAVQTVIAIAIIIFTGQLVQGGVWAVLLAAGIALGVIGLIVIAWLIVRRQKNVDWLSATATKFVNKVMKKIWRGKKRKYLKEEDVVRFFGDLRADYLQLRSNRKILWKPFLWGFIYSFLELATYWVVGLAMGHPEILPQIMIAEGVGSVVGTVLVTPGGVGGYEAAFIAVLAATGVPLHVATITVIVTRVCVLLGTIVCGFVPYQMALLSRPDKFDAKKVEKEIAKENAEAAAEAVEKK